MDGATLQQKIYKGYAKAALRLGLEYTIYRSADGQNPIQAPNIVGTTLVSPTTTWSYNIPKKYGDATWLMLLDGRVTEVGDYLIGPNNRTFFIAGMQHLLPILGVLCDRVVSVKRPISPTGHGYVGHSGYEDSNPDTDTPLLEECPAAFLKSSRGEKNPVKIPTGDKMPWYAVFLPAWSNVFLRNGDIITDNNEQEFVISDNEHTELGWHLNVHGLET